METMKSRSVSPFSRSKVKSHFSGASENGSMVIEQIKAKKKGLRNKSKSQQCKKDDENIANNGKSNSDSEEPILSEMGANPDAENSEQENGINHEDNNENDNGDKKVEEQLEDDQKNDNALINVCDMAEESNSTESSSQIIEKTTGETESNKVVLAEDIEEDRPKQFDSPKTSGAEDDIKNENLVAGDLLPDSNFTFNKSEEIPTEEPNDSCSGNSNTNQEPEDTAESSDVKEFSQVIINGSEISSQSKEVNTMEDIQSSPDTATRDDNSLSYKISNFFGKLSYSQEQKQDSEVSSSKKIDSAPKHPFLSRVSGRRGIKDRLNSSAIVFCSNELEVKTPKNSGISLDDSFRVRTNPPSLNSLDLKENSTLRKFKGKRCLNAGDEPEEEEEIYFNTMKRRKLDEKTQEPGLWRSILWSPFKKKAFDDEGQLKLATNESKLSRLLSPFWFWKKTAAGQKGK